MLYATDCIHHRERVPSKQKVLKGLETSKEED
jgi:hypothetical protein